MSALIINQAILYDIKYQCEPQLIVEIIQVSLILSVQGSLSVVYICTHPKHLWCKKGAAK